MSSYQPPFRMGKSALRCTVMQAGRRKARKGRAERTTSSCRWGLFCSGHLFSYCKAADGETPVFVRMVLLRQVHVLLRTGGWIRSKLYHRYTIDKSVFGVFLCERPGYSYLFYEWDGEPDSNGLRPLRGAGWQDIRHISAGLPMRRSLWDTSAHKKINDPCRIWRGRSVLADEAASCAGPFCAACVFATYFAPGQKIFAAG